MRTLYITLAVVFLASPGCGEPAPYQGPPAAGGGTEPLAASDQETRQPDLQPTPDSTEQRDIVANDAAESDNAVDTATHTVEVAKPTHGKRGQGYGGGFVTEPVRQYFLTQHRIAFLQVENAVKMFKGVNGRMPNSHEEYMEKIIEENGITLPELQNGEEYFYDPEKGELMVRRPR